MSHPTTNHLQPGPRVTIADVRPAATLRSFVDVVVAVALAAAVAASLLAAVVSARGRFDGTPAPLAAPTLVTDPEALPPLVVEPEHTPYPTPAGA